MRPRLSWQAISVIFLLRAFVNPLQRKTKFSVYRNLDRLNRLSRDEAVQMFLQCSGSLAWAERMSSARPFPMLEQLFMAARRIWITLDPADINDVLTADPGHLPTSSFANSKQGVIVKSDGAKVDRFPSEPAISGSEPDVGLRFAAVRHYRQIEKRLSSLLET